MEPHSTRIFLLEYDRRFAVYGEQFSFYDYNNPLELAGSLQEHTFDLVVADPPFLAQECMEKTAITVKFLAKSKVLFCTGKCDAP